MNFHTMDIGKDDTKADPDDWVAFDSEDAYFDPQWDESAQAQAPAPEPEPIEFQQWQPTQPQEPQDMSTPEPSDADPPFDPYSGVSLKKTVSAERTGSALTATTHPETPPRRQKKQAVNHGAPAMPTTIAKNLSSDTDSNSHYLSEDPEQPSFADNENKSKAKPVAKPSRRNCIFCLVLAIILLVIAGALGFIVYMHLFHEVDMVETEVPSTEPSLEPTSLPSSLPSSRPTVDSASPTSFVTPGPTTRPPTSPPSRSPSNVPSASPTDNPSATPSLQPSNTRDELRDLIAKISDGGTVQAINLPGTPQQRAYEWVHNDPAYLEFKERRIVQRFAMAVLYYSTVRSETSKEAMESWMDYDTNECTWFTSWYLNRDACGIDNIIKTLALRNVALTGTIPSELALLTHLNTLVLSDNQLTGSVPEEFGKWASLITLDLNSNFLSGRIPLIQSSPSIPMSLRELSLGSNRITGIVPSSIANLNLTSLDLSENNVQGIIPPALCSTAEQSSQLKLMAVDCDKVTCFCCTQCGANRTRAPVLTPFTPPPSPAPTPRPTQGPTSCVSNIQVSKRCYKVGEPLEISFSNCNPRAGDWIGLYDSESPEQFLMDPLMWHWSCGSKSCQGSPTQGSSTLDASAEGQAFWPLNRGNYKIYLIRNGASFPYQTVATSEEIRVAQSICPD
ncbi:unnamed protein product [Cylindrotheca closterium]|uniref:L domain-like protein n=1 Tax=Cylindrotheca closterium TaxID=2856 RepID=A0AAD2FNX0_9STRA|nr:unnamed protein product [Cylindrotheca closterium]